MTHVLLLRSPEPASAPYDGKDPYEAELARLGPDVTMSSIPVYETIQTLDKLNGIIEAGPTVRDYRGVIVTSRRAVDAWVAAARRCTPEDKRVHWGDVPFFVVGAATARAAHAMREALSSDSRRFFTPGKVLGGEETGTGERLAHFILNHVERTRQAAGPLTTSVSGTELADAASIRVWKMLFLTGDKTRDVLPEILGKSGCIQLESVQVYTTRPSPRISTVLQDVMQRVDSSKVRDWWITFFAPSSAEFSLPSLRNHFTLPEIRQPDVPAQTRSKDDDGSPMHTVRVAVIGPTTAAHLRDKLKLDVAVIAAKPNPEELSAGIKAVMI